MECPHCHKTIGVVVDDVDIVLEGVMCGSMRSDLLQPTGTIVGLVLTVDDPAVIKHACLRDCRGAVVHQWSASVYDTDLTNLDLPLPIPNRSATHQYRLDVSFHLPEIVPVANLRYRISQVVVGDE